VDAHILHLRPNCPLLATLRRHFYGQLSLYTRRLIVMFTEDSGITFAEKGAQKQFLPEKYNIFFKYKFRKCK
jgi:hypothetical protein